MDTINQKAKLVQLSNLSNFKQQEISKNCSAKEILSYILHLYFLYYNCPYVVTNQDVLSGIMHNKKAFQLFSLLFLLFCLPVHCISIALRPTTKTTFVCIYVHTRPPYWQQLQQNQIIFFIFQGIRIVGAFNFWLIWYDYVAEKQNLNDAFKSEAHGGRQKYLSSL